MTKALKALNVADKKRAQEQAFLSWANENDERKAKYGNVLNLYQEAYGELLSTQAKRDYFIEGFASSGVEIISLAWNYTALNKVLSMEEQEPKQVDGLIQKLKAANEAHFKDWNADVDQKVFAKMFEMYAANVSEDQWPEAFANANAKAKGDFSKYAAGVFKKSMFADPEKLGTFLDKPSAKVLAKDPAYILADGIFTDYIKNVSAVRRGAGGKMAKAERLYIDAIRQMDPNKSYYPDANSTLRMTYGNVLPYKARDAVFYEYYTTADGILEKYKPGDHEFDVPDKLIQLIENKDYGRYGKEGELRVCFFVK